MLNNPHSRAKEILRILLIKTASADKLPDTLSDEIVNDLLDPNLVRVASDNNISEIFLEHRDNNRRTFRNSVRDAQLVAAVQKHNFSRCLLTDESWHEERSELKKSLADKDFLNIARRSGFEYGDILYAQRYAHERDLMKRTSKDTKFLAVLKMFDLELEYKWRDDYSHKTLLMLSHDDKVINLIATLSLPIRRLLTSDGATELRAVLELSDAAVAEKLISLRVEIGSDFYKPVKRLLNYPEVFEPLNAARDIVEVLRLPEGKFSQLAARFVNTDIGETLAATQGSGKGKDAAA